MAVTSVERIWVGEATSGNLAGERTFTAQYRVLTDSADDDAWIVKKHPDIPKEGDEFTVDGDLFYVDSVQVERDRGTRLKSMVTVRFTNAPNAEDLDNSKENNGATAEPLEIAAFVDWTSQEIYEDAQIDVDGKPIENAAGDAFDPPIQQPVTLWTAHVEKNVPELPGWMFEYAGAINDDSFTIDGVSVAPQYARIVAPKCSRWKFRKNIRYRTLTYELQFKTKPDVDNNVYDGVTKDSTNPTPWQAIRRNAGLRELVTVDGVDKVRQCLDADGFPVNAPIDLNIEGGKLTWDTSRNPGLVTFLAWNIHKKKTFSGTVPLS